MQGKTPFLDAKGLVFLTVLAAAAVLVPILFLATHRVSASAAAGWVAVSLFALTRLTWMYSVGAEVFALNNLLCAALIHQAVVFFEQPTLRRASITAWVSGLAMSNQHTSALYLAVLVPAVMYHGRAVLFKPASLLVGQLVVTYFTAVNTEPPPVPCRVCNRRASMVCIHPDIGSHEHGRADLGRPAWPAGIYEVRNYSLNTSTLTRRRHFLREEYGTFSLANRQETSSTLYDAYSAQFAAFTQETLYLGPALFLIGALSPFPRGLRLGQNVLLSMVLFYVAFFNWRANLVRALMFVC